MNVIQRAIMKPVAKEFRPTIRQNYALAGDLCKTFYKKYGKDVIPVIAEVMVKNGVAQAGVMQKMMKVKDMKSIGEAYKISELVMDMGIDVTDLTDDTFHLKITRCPCGLEGTSRELCEVIMITDKKMISTMLGQEVEMKVIKSIASGDKECEISFSKNVEKK
jgi:hypothetical protein